MERNKSLFKKISIINQKSISCDESLRKAVQEFMGSWKSNTIKDDSVHSSTIMYENEVGSCHCVFFLYPGESELIAIVNNEDTLIGEDDMWWDILTIKELRIIINKLPTAISEIVDQMDQNMKANEESLSLLRKLTTEEALNNLMPEKGL